MFMVMKNKNNSQFSSKAFSLIETSIVIVIIGILITGVTQGSRLVAASKLTSAQNLTKGSPVPSIKDLVFWYETTLDNSVTSGVAANDLSNSDDVQDGDFIKNWNDSNPLKNSKIKATIGLVGALALDDTYRPTYVRNGINGLPSLGFRRSTDKLIVPVSIDYTVKPNITIFAVFVYRGTDGAIFGQDNGSWDRFLSVNIGVSNGAGSQPFPISTNDNHILSYVARNAVTNGSNVYLNGVMQVGAGFTDNHTNSGDGFLAIGVIGSGGGYEQNIDMDIGEFILFDRALKKSERQDIEKYLSKKWGIAVQQ